MHDEHLKDFYAGLAMLGMLNAGRPPSYMTEIADLAWDVADAMMVERSNRKERNVNERTS
jgi:hypothetical protein